MKRILVVEDDPEIGGLVELHLSDEGWAVEQRARCLRMLDDMLMEEGYFCREPAHRHIKFAFTNYGVSIGLP